MTKGAMANIMVACWGGGLMGMDTCIHQVHMGMAIGY